MAYPGAVEAHPGTMEAHTGAMKARPGALEAFLFKLLKLQYVGVLVNLLLRRNEKR
jgi:hypothetical protein